MKQTKQNQVYVAPVAECLEIETEQCIAVSPGGGLDGMGENPIFTE